MFELLLLQFGIAFIRTKLDYSKLVGWLSSSC